MTNEDLNRKIEFIIEQQAQFTVNFQKADERMSRLEELVGRLAQVTTVGFNDLIEKVNVIADAQIKFEDHVATLAEKMAELAEAQTHTDKRLDALIDIVSEGRNGKTREL